jgi:transposase-like protein
MSVREIQGHLRDLYGIEASPQLISTVTDGVLEEVGCWQSPPLEALYALVLFDAIRVEIRDNGKSRPFLVGLRSRHHAAMASRCFGMILPKGIFGR